ncbi:MAG: hypothetical protein U0Q11_06970 [Vicinamibacterales bacterium]
MNPRTREAISACTRTLAEASDADVALAVSEVVTLGPLRAAADRAALRCRHHDDRLADSYRPQDGVAGILFDALHTARLDAIGASWLTGVSRNLLAHPGTDDDGLRWTAFECGSGLAAPREKTALVAAARTALPPAMLADLAALMALMHDQAAFSREAAGWALRASSVTPVPRSGSVQRGFNIPGGPVGVDIRRGRYAMPARNRQREEEADATDGSQSASAARRDADDPILALEGYRIFTTEFDRVVHAASLASRDELAALRLKLDKDFSQVRSLVSRLAKRLLRALMARQAREWRFDQDDGLLDASRLPVFVASGGSARPFKQEFESPFPSTVVTLLIDHSGSMKGRSMQIAALTVEIFARVLERCGVACEILGFTTREWDGGEPARKWADAGYPPEPGRLNALEHIVIKPADVPWRRARLALGLFLRDEMLKENIDGEALAWAHRRLLARSERRRILVVVSDGTPMDEATFAVNGFEYLDGHLASVVQYIETRSPIRLAAIGIGHDVSQFYRNATRISKIDDLGPALTARG